MLYCECILLNLTLLFLKSFWIKVEYKGFLRISESNVWNFKQSIATFSADKIKHEINNKLINLKFLLAESLMFINYCFQIFHI